MNEIKFTLRLADGRWVGSPTHTATTNPNLAGVFRAADPESAAEQRRAMERIHGPLGSVPFSRHPANSGPDHSEEDPFAEAEVLYSYTRKHALADGEQIDVSVTTAEAGLSLNWPRFHRLQYGSI